MKVLMSADTVGGVFTYATDLVAGLRAHDVDVVVATFGAPMTAFQHDALVQAGAVAFHESALKLEWMDEPRDDVEAGRTWLRELVEQERPDVVHLNGFAHATAGFEIPVVVAAHSCVRSWWEAVHGTDAPAAWDRYDHAVRAGLRRADAVIAPTAAMLDAVERLYGPLSSPTLVVPNGSAAAEAPADVVKEPFVLAAGRMWDEAKNLRALDAAADGLGFPVRVAGDPGDRDTSTAVELLGHLAPVDLAAVRRRAAVFAAPARYEPFGLAALEAARDGCALVLGDIPSLREVWGDAAVYVDPVAPDALRVALRALLEDPAAARAAGARAQRHAARYTAAAMASAHHRLYRELVPAEVAA